MMYKNIITCLTTTLLFIGGYAQKSKNFEIPFEKFTLDNGLQVIYHIDRSDPVVAVSITAHVGSAREKIKRTGFAHLFEHLLFLDSENLGRDGLDQMSARIGGSGANGFTNRDLTNYLQTVPNDALEKMLWAEADKLGWFINTVTDPVLSKEKEVVKNEKRGRYDNRPYGHTHFVIGKNLYPTSHPYNWQVIGSLEDLENTTLEDVKEFYNKWYVPNNVTLVIAGDFDVAQTTKWVHKYFDEIPKGAIINNAPKQPITLEKSKKLYHEDNFARLPELTVVWPTTEKFHSDNYALDVLTDYLAYGNNAPLYKVIVEQEQLSSRVNMWNWSSELAGQMHLTVRAFKGVNLDKVHANILESFLNFEKDGIPQKDLDRIKIKLESQFYDGVASVLDKGSTLARYNTIAGNPDMANKEMEQLLAVTKEDVMRVYKQYIKEKHYVATSFVPLGEKKLALKESIKADVSEEKIVKGAEKTFSTTDNSTGFKRTPSSFDRTIEPKYGKKPVINTPPIWEKTLSNGMKIYAIENNEIPVVNFNVILDGGQLLENKDKIGVANILAKMLSKGTKSLTAVQFQDALEQLGASIYVRANQESIIISGTTLSRNYKKTINLLKEMILEPRWDKNEFNLIQQSVLSQILEDKGSPNACAANEFNILLYGSDNILAHNIKGSTKSVKSIEIDDLIKYHSAYIRPNVTKFLVVGDIDKETVIISSNEFKHWKNKPVEFPKITLPKRPETSQVYFYDIPGAKQSILKIGYPAITALDKDFYRATIMNYKLGGGGFASILTQQVRNTKGYTYGIRSRFSGSRQLGSFSISSSVRSNVTLESVQLVKEILETYGPQFGKEELATTKSFLIKSNARAFETANAKLKLIRNIANYNWPYDYVNQREDIVNKITIADIQLLSTQYLDPTKMIWLITGDAETQFKRIKELNLGDPVLLNK